ncbi:MAG: DUF4878 domain-containing protein [Campylobacter sp.]|uniref:DUF4878 domain-containing protein n=1 Tax=Campylobacter sp. TaxID=205 RepID=UPI002AA85857|nr:DUF4878 domain-containing protein [Campylobacter sp.]MCI7246546.1 DUF4878 domain-containing protein [Campylobacter sp.]
MKFTRLLLIAILTFFITCGQESAEDVALNAIKALISGNDKKLNEYFALDEVTKSQGEQSAIKSKLKETSQELQEKIAKNGGLKDILVLNSTDEDDGIVVEINMLFNNQNSEKSQVKLEKIDGRWAVSF